MYLHVHLQMYHIIIITYILLVCVQNLGGSTQESGHITFTVLVRHKTQPKQTCCFTILDMPEELEEMNCVVDNYIDSMNCSWDTGKPYRIYFAPNILFQW